MYYFPGFEHWGSSVGSEVNVQLPATVYADEWLIKWFGTN